MKFYFILPLLVIFTFLGYTQESKLLVSINTNECQMCYKAHSTLAKFYDIATIDLIFPEKYNRAVRYLKKQCPVDLTRCKIILSDSLYKKISVNGFSGFLLEKNGETCFRGKLRQLHLNVDSIKQLIHKSILSQSVMNYKDIAPISPLNQRTNICTNGKEIITFDVTLGEIVIYDSEKYKPILSEDFSVDSLHQLYEDMGTSLILYRENLTKLKEFGSTDVKFTGCTLNNEYLFILMYIPKLAQNEQSRLRVGRKSLLLRLHIPTREQQLFQVPWSRKLAKNKKIRSSTVVYADNEQVLLKATSKTEPYDKNFLAQYVYNEDTVHFLKMHPFEQCDFYINNPEIVKMVQPSNHGTIIFSPMSNIIYDIEDDKTYQLPITPSEYNIDMENYSNDFDYFISDAYIFENCIRFLYSTDGGKHRFLGQCALDGSNFKFKNVDDLTAPLLPMKIYNSSHIIYYDDDKEMLCFKEVEL